MPSNAARNRLIEYYQSPDFADDVVGHIGQDSSKARIYRQHIVDRLNTSLQNNGGAISDVVIQAQERFVRADMPVADLVFQARLYALQWIKGETHESEE